MNWVETTVGEFCPFIYGKGLPKTKREEGSVPVYGSNGCVDYHSESYVKGPGIIIGRKGSVGAVHLSEEPFWPIDTSFYLVKESLEELKFTYYLLKSLGLEEMNSDSAVPGLNRENAHALTIRVPELKEDREVLGRWISVYDEKIELNRQTNQTLEHIAQAIFKSWFVDFEPTRAKIQAKASIAAGKMPGSEKSLPEDFTKQDEKRLIKRAAMAAISGKPLDELGQLNPEQLKQLKNTAALFPESLVDSELGEIPEGWYVKKIADCVQRSPVGKKFTQKTSREIGKIPVLDQGKSGIIGYHDEKPGVEASTDNPIIVFANHTCYMRLIMHDFSTIQNVLPFKGVDLDIFWIYEATYGKQEFVEYKGHWPDFSIKEIVVPLNNLDGLFGEFTKTLHIKIYENEREIVDLCNLRDALLPKLLSGELEIKEEI